jgi:hypothetical protein
MGRASGLVVSLRGAGEPFVLSRSISCDSGAASSMTSTLRLAAVSHEGMAGSESAWTFVAPSNVAVWEKAPGPAYTGAPWDWYCCWLLYGVDGTESRCLWPLSRPQQRQQQHTRSLPQQMQREMHQRREMTMREPMTMPMMAGHLRDQ